MKNLLATLRSLPRRAGVALLAFVATFGVLAGAASAAPVIPVDPTAGAMDDVSTSVITWITTYGVPVLFAMIGFGIVLRLGIKWAKKAGRAAG